MDIFGKTLFCLPKTAPICFLLTPHAHWECRAHGNQSANQASEQQLSWATPATTWGKENSQKQSNAWSSNHTKHFIYNSLLRTNHIVSHDFKVSLHHVKGGRTWNTGWMGFLPKTSSYTQILWSPTLPMQIVFFFLHQEKLCLSLVLFTIQITI